MDRGSEMVSKYCTSQNDMAIQFHDYKHELWVPTDFSLRLPILLLNRHGSMSLSF